MTFMPIKSRFIALCLLLLTIAATSCSTPTHTENLASYNIREYDQAINRHIVDITHSMPSNGGYSTRSDAFDALREGVKWNESSGTLIIVPRKAQPSFCSSACYLVLLQLLESCRDASGKSPYSSEIWKSLAILEKQPDGDGIWGRANANGSGFAKLIHDLRAGYNFTDYNHALPGDFMKIFWTNEIGKREHGHLVVYLGRDQDSHGNDRIRFWSSNTGNGYSVKTVPTTSIKRVLFTRITTLRAFDRIPALPYRDEWLASHLTRRISAQDMYRRCGVGTVMQQTQK